MVRKAILLAASIFLTWQSLGLLRVLPELEDPTIPRSLAMAFALNLFILGIFAFAGFALPTERLLPERYYRIRRPELLKSIYRTFNVPLFRKFLLVTFWRSKKQQLGFFNGKRNGLQRMETTARKSEFGHLIPGVLLTVVSVYLLSRGLILMGVFTLIINMLSNYYPVILQRHHRMRLMSLLQP